MLVAMDTTQMNLISKLKLRCRAMSIGSLDIDDIFIASSAILLFLPFEWTMVIASVILVCAAMKGTLAEAIRRQPAAVWLYAFAGMQLFSSLMSSNSMGVLNSLGTFAVGMLVALFCRVLNPRNFKAAMQVTAILSCFAAFAGIGEFVRLAEQNQADLLFCLKTIPEYVRIRVTYYNPNLYAAMLDFFIAISAYLFFDTDKRSSRLLWFGAAVLNLIALFLTGSRMALVPLPFILPLFLFFMHKGKWFWTVLGTEGGMLACILSHPHLIPRFGASASVDARFEIWENAIHGIRENPLFGGGPQYYAMIDTGMFSRPAPHAHNLVLDVLLNSGIIGTALLMTYLAKILKYSADSRLHKELPLFAPLMLSMLASVLIVGLADCTINFPATALLMLAVLNVPAYLHQEDTVTLTRPVSSSFVLSHSLSAARPVSYVSRTQMSSSSPLGMRSSISYSSLPDASHSSLSAHSQR